MSTRPVKKLKKNFNDKIVNTKSYKTPAVPGETIIKTAEIEEVASKVPHRLFRSGVGMLLYLVKYSRPDIANSVREIAKMMDGPTEQQMKSLFRLIKYVIDTEDMGLVISPMSNMNIV